MDVRCERCRAQYVFDDEQVTPSGLTVQCTNCGHVFKVKKKELVVTVPVKPGEMDGAPMPATAAAPRPGGAHAAPPSLPEPDRPREWRVRQANGNVFTFRELTTLQKWIVEQKVARDDEISLSGDQWKRLGNIAELASFFQVVEAAERAKTGAAPLVTPVPLPVYGVPIQTGGFALPAGYPPPPYAAPPHPPAEAAPAATETAELDAEETAAVRRGGGATTAILVALLLVALGAAGYVFGPRFFPRKPAPDALAVPITLEAKPAAPGAAPPAPGGAPGGEMPQPTATPVPVPVAAPEPVAEPALHEAPEPVERPVAKAPAVPRSPKALLAQANRLRAKGNLEAALDLYGRVADDDPANAEALTGRGLCYLDLSSYAPAEASFQAALKSDPDRADALLGLAETYRWQGKKGDAISYYEKYLARHPDGDEAAVARNALEELRK